MDLTSSLNIFGIEIKYNPGWRIIPDNSYSLNYDSGLFRFEENVMEKRSRISMGLRWECSQTDNETFLKEFSQSIQAEYQKALKGKSHSFEILRDEVVENAQGVRMCMIETQYKATQSIINNPQKMQRLCVCNVAFYCEKTHRMIICSFVTTPQYRDAHREEIEEIFISLQTHPVYLPQEEAERMEKRAQSRGEARKQSRSGLAGIKQLLAAKKP